MGDVAVSDKSSSAGRRDFSNLVRRIVLLMLCLSVTAAAVWGVYWWRAWPLARAESLLEQGESRKALEEIDAYLKDHPGEQRALVLKARVLVKRGQWSIAIRMFEKYGAATAAELHAWAEALLHRQQWSEARSVLSRVLDLEPENPDALHEMTACQAKLGRLDEALVTAERFAGQPGCAARGHLLLATLHKELGNRKSALQAYHQVLTIHPDAKELQISTAEFFLEYGKSLLADGQVEAAAPLLERSVKTEPSDLAYVELGEAYSQLNQPDRARSAWEQALKLNADSVPAREALSNSALRAGDPQAALKWLLPLRDVEDPGTSLAYLFQRAYTLVGNEQQAQRWTEITARLRKRQRVYAAVENVLSEAPRSFWARVIRAHQFANEGNWVQAERMLAPLRASIQRKPTPFVEQLFQAIQRRGPLPSLESLPITLF